MHCTARHAVVTGASTGIGRATALRLCRDGFHVFATVRRQADGEAVKEAAHGRLSSLLMDVTDAGQIAEAVRSIRDHVGPAGLDVLVNNAGIGLAWPVELVPLEAFRRQFAVNVDGQIAVTQACLPAIRQAQGRIVMIGSIGDRITIPFGSPLTAAKYALRSLTDALRLELAPWNIRVILIEPGCIRTDALDKLDRDVKAAEQDFGPDGWALYGDAFTRMTTRALAREARGSNPDVVAAVISRGLHDPRPKSRYLVGKDARLLAAVAALPAAVLDRLRRRIFDLPPPGFAVRPATSRTPATQEARPPTP